MVRMLLSTLFLCVLLVSLFDVDGDWVSKRYVPLVVDEVVLARKWFQTEQGEKAASVGRGR